MAFSICSLSHCCTASGDSVSFSGRWPVKQQRWRRFSCSVGSGFSSPGRETGYVDFNREQGRMQEAGYCAADSPASFLFPSPPDEEVLEIPYEYLLILVQLFRLSADIRRINIGYAEKVIGGYAV